MKPNVLIIYTGGTIGMVNDPNSGMLTAFDFDNLYHQIPELKRLNVQLQTISFDKPVDSSEMNPSYWKQIATNVFDSYNDYDGFVVLHGSDTMAYTATALSFMLQGLKKPVILTGSQLPINEIRTDGRENVLTSIEIAAAKNLDGSSKVNEVCIYFENNLYRGNRTTKISANAFEAFASPNFSPLATAGIHINYQKVSYPFENDQLKLNTELDNRVALLKIFPGFNAKVYKSLFDFQNVKGIVLETFGAGNAPTDQLFDDLIADYIDQGGVVLNITQCQSGSVEQGLYETSSFFQKIGVIGGGDMTTEAAICKLMFALGSSTDKLEIEKILKQSIAGELSVA
ncbi:MAG: asparaginase [Crocinitomicaceae bacterium]|jgi:L-asparaginase